MFKKSCVRGLKYLGDTLFLQIRSSQGLVLAYLQAKSVKKGLKYQLRRTLVVKACQEVTLLSEKNLGKVYALTQYYQQIPLIVDNSKAKIHYSTLGN